MRVLLINDYIDAGVAHVAGVVADLPKDLAKKLIDRGDATDAPAETATDEPPENASADPVKAAAKK